MEHALRSVEKCEGMNPHTSKGASTLGIGILMDSQIFRELLKGSKINGLRSSLYHWKLLERRCLKWAPITHLDISNTSYGQKKGRESNWQFDSRPLKIKNHPDFLACRWLLTYWWKAFDKGYNIALDLISLKKFHAKLWAYKVVGVPVLRISGLPLGSLGKKCHLDMGLMKRHKVYYKGEGGGFPQEAMVSLVSLSLPWLVLAPKVLQLCSNQLVVWFCVGPCEWLSACHSS